MRYVRRNGQYFTCSHDGALASNSELQRPLDYIRQLFVVMAVQRNHTTLLQRDARKHHVCSGNHLALQLGIERFEFDLGPGVMPDFEWGIFVSHSARLK